MAELKAAISKGVAVLKSGGVCVIDFHVEPLSGLMESDIARPGIDQEI